MAHGELHTAHGVTAGRRREIEKPSHKPPGHVGQVLQEAKRTQYTAVEPSAENGDHGNGDRNDNVSRQRRRGILHLRERRKPGNHTPFHAGEQHHKGKEHERTGNTANPKPGFRTGFEALG